MRLSASAFLFTMVFAIVGCGPSEPVKHEVHGRVKLSGQDVPGAQVQFATDKAGVDAVTAICGEDGTYKLMVPAGENTVRILAQKLVPAKKGLTGPYGVQIDKVTEDIIPPKYNVKSELRVTVQGPMEKNFDLLP
ncbi:MAG: carboxypeptidase-like regulatory domain-containing protein [Planctomycetes bacterium]|nr:carboxypeptidase-like regulatory domain-containing protein [Planctomycetota bacterium]